MESRIKSDPQIYGSLSPANQALVRQGRIAEGCRRPAVFLAWGDPDRIRSGERYGNPFEVWVYTTIRTRFRRTMVTTPVTMDMDIFAAGFGGIVTISILLASIRILTTRIRTLCLTRYRIKSSYFEKDRCTGWEYLNN